MIPGYRLVVEKGRDTTGRSLYQEGARIQITADPAASGQVFDQWTGGDEHIFTPGTRTAADTIITMPANHVTVTATYHTHEYEGEWHHDDTNHWQLCSCGEAGPKTAHSGGTANCHEKAVCGVCHAAYGSLDPDNHDGKTELRDQKAATEDSEGYTGDTYCVGCGGLLKKGKAISRTTIPPTGDDTVLWPWVMLAALVCSGLLAYRKPGCKKRHK